MRKVGEKLALVQPRDTENLSTEREEAARQVSIGQLSLQREIGFC